MISPVDNPFSSEVSLNSIRVQVIRGRATLKARVVIRGVWGLRVNSGNKGNSDRRSLSVLTGSDLGKARDRLRRSREASA